MAPQASGYASRAILSPLPQLLVLRSHLQCHLPASLLDHLHLLLTLSSPVRTLPLNFPLSLKLFPFPFPLNFSEPVPLKLSILRIQRINALFYILPGLKLNSET